MKAVSISFTAFLFSLCSVAQNKADSSRYKTMAAGAEYERSSFYQGLWGKNYRKEWTTPVTFPVTKLDTLRGGIVKFKMGGGHQSKSLHLKSNADKEYALRSVNKSLKVLIPEIFYNTFIEHIANDAISMSHPYGALGVPYMAGAAGIPHANPQFMWVPKQPLLDTLNAVYGDRLYLFEERAAGDWSDNHDYLNFKKFINSEELLEKMFEDNDNQADQVSFVKDRLFDMLIGDWDRHWDQWKWGKLENGETNLYVPVPTDRDQAFSTTGGFLLTKALKAAGMKYIRPFDYTIKDVTFVERRFLDRIMTNRVTLDQWRSQASDLQKALTDQVIETSIRQMPPEIFAISGNDIVAKLKSRRQHLEEYATEYYYFLAKEVEIVGSKETEVFEINRGENETVINVYDVNKEGQKKKDPFYSRTFNNSETKEIRLYGLSGNDQFNISGSSNSAINIRIIGGDEKDAVNNSSNTRIHLYDEGENSLTGKIRLHRITDSADHKFDYDTYRYDKKGISPLLGYNREDRLFVGLGYTAIHHKWRKLPFASKQSLGVRYSISQKDFSAFYKGLFPGAIAKWDLMLNADYDAIRWLNFYGVGNNTTTIKKDLPFNRTQSREIYGALGLQRTIGKHTFNITGFYENVKVINDSGRFIAKNIAPAQPSIYNANDYAGASLTYSIALLNDSIVPTKGFSFSANAGHFQNFTKSSSFQRYTGLLRLYIPLSNKFSIAIRGYGGTVTGNPMYYHLPHIGGADDLRGYRRERFWGKTAFANSNELRFITNLRSYIVNGKIGLVAFYDEGRIWQPGEVSNKWHTDYGAGLLLAPFNALLANIAYGISSERKMWQLRIIKSF